MIVPILLVIFVITFVACVIVKRVKKNIKEENLKKVKLKEHEEKLNSVVPGTILIKESKTSNNPFKVEDLSSIKILETKRNSSGEIWVKYAYENIVRPGKYFESCPSYDSLEDKLKLYPIIELPKEQ